MRKGRWLASWRSSGGKPVFYHCISRVVDRRFVFGLMEKEKFRTLMRMQEKFTGCRVLSYCLMANHFHLMLEVPPVAAAGLTDELLLRRLRALYREAFVAVVATELAEARGSGPEGAVASVHARFNYRMHDLGEFMKGLLQRFTQWFNRTHSRTGRLWEDRFKSVIVEDGVAAKTIAAYIDLNPVRAGIVKDPADYRWSSYGEAIGGSARGNGKTARAGLIRALGAKALNPNHEILTEDAERGEDAALWKEVARGYRQLLMSGAVGKSVESVGRDGETVVMTTRKGISKDEARAANEGGGEIPFGKMLRHRVRYFTDGAIIGSRIFVNEAFAASKVRFGPRRETGARKLRGVASPAAGVLWSVRDFRKGIA